MQNLVLAGSVKAVAIEGVLKRPEAEASKSSKALQGVIAQLAQELTRGGKLDQSSPLGKMLAKAMEGDGEIGRSQGDVKAALDKLIHEKLGNNFGASAGLNGGGQTLGASRHSLLEQVLNGLAKAALNDLLTNQSNGASFSPDDMPMLKKIAEFMDANPAYFKKPDAGSWSEELTEDNLLDGDETAQFRAALDILSQQLDSQQSLSGSLDGGGERGGGLGSPAPSFVEGTKGLNIDHSAERSEGTGSSVGKMVGEMVDLGLQSVLSGGGLGSPLSSVQSLGDSSDGRSSQTDVGKLLTGLFDIGLEVSLNGRANAHAGKNLNESAALIATMLCEMLLQSGSKMTVA